ncbi:MAG TPA: NAD(P)H-quinone oxidoreductase [Streptosporangiaceae bacterium]|jgi:putative PIG3 family NAD(P)H quinone oxidoreductase
MRAIVITEPGGPEVLAVEQVPDPVPGPDEVVIGITAAGVNRADLMQRQGLYPPPPGAPPYPGLECSGQILATGSEVSDWEPGDKVCALLAGGGYAEQVAVPAGQVMPLPPGIGVADAAALPEAACTVYANVFMQAALAPGEILLVHGGSSGIGTMAIQLGHAAGARVACTAGSPAKLERCRELGADLAINYREEDFTEAIDKFTGGHGADVILDIVGAPYLPQNVRALATGGRLIVIGMQGGATGELNLARLLARRASVFAASLRARPAGEKAAIVSATQAHVWPLIGSGQVGPVIDQILPLEQAPRAHRLLDASEHIGKILLAT